MNPKLKVVFDSNVYIAAALNPAGSSEAWLRIAGRQLRSFDLYVSEAILDEVAEKLSDKFTLPEQQIRHFIAAVRDVAVVVQPKHKLRVVLADPDDDMLFECAVAAQAQLLVSADKEVLKLSPYEGIGICHPSDLKKIFVQDLKYL
jgi:uncharacterized protein